MKLFSNKNIFLISLIYFIILFTQLVIAKNSNFIISGGASLNTNLYISDFNKIQDFKTCCPSYNSAIGLGYSLYGGLEYKTNSDILGFKYNISLMASYSNLSAEYSEEEFIANVINSNDYSKAYSVHILDANINAVAIEPGIVLEPDFNFPIFFKIGFILGFPLSPTVKLEERLISPDYVAFDTLGNRVRDRQSGNLPYPSSYMIAPFIGAGYELYNSGSFSLTSILQFNYSIKNISKSLDWKIHSIRAGFSLNYNLPMPSLPPPIRPPIPDLPHPPLPPAPGKIELALNVFKDNIKLESGDTVEFPLEIKEYNYKFSVIPVIFYKKNSVEYSDDYSNYFNNESGGLISVKDIDSGIDPVQLTIKYLKNEPSVNVKLTAYSSDDESADINRNRLNTLKARLINSGIDESRIKTDEFIHSASSYPNEQLLEEHRKIIIEFSDKINTLLGESSEQISKADTLHFHIKPDIICDSKHYDFIGKISYNGIEIKELTEEPQSYIITSDIINEKGALLAFSAKLRDADNQERADDLQISLKPKKIITVFNNKFTASDKTQAEYHILGYCEFDKSQFYAINESTLNYIKSAINEGKKVEILPLTDNLGTPEHNFQLAKARAANALRILKVQEKDAKVIYPENYIFSNDKPIGRMLNRSVICRIISKVN